MFTRDFVKAGIIYRGKDVGKPRVRPWQRWQLSGKAHACKQALGSDALTQVAAFGGVTESSA